ncbi:MAG: radical SAM protein [Deltaproteobacteria bacterium]|nr:radical SAM protein [Deltaproteobacteria bacterium]
MVGTGAEAFREHYRPVPMTSFLVKVHSRCNLMCDYCYEYNCGNISWKKKPREMPWEVYSKAVDRIVSHAVRHSVPCCFFSFHGGEPLLRTPDFFRRAVDYAREAGSRESVEINFGMQTNGTLLNAEWAETLADLSICCGVSLDGPEDAHNEFRVYSNGLPSYSDVIAGLEWLLTPRGRTVWTGFLTVINPVRDPVEIFDHLAAFSPPFTDFLEPHGSWNKMPVGKMSPEDTTYGDWLIRLFDSWFGTSRGIVPIRKFDEIIEHVYGGRGMLESFGLESVDIVTVATDGAYETVDCIKVAHPEAENLGLNVFDHSLDDVMNHPKTMLRQMGLAALPDRCRGCDVVGICGGGYFAHRYSPETGFRNPSIFCADLYKLIHHIKDRISETLKDSPAETVAL